MPNEPAVAAPAAAAVVAPAAATPNPANPAAVVIPDAAAVAAKTAADAAKTAADAEAAKALRGTVEKELRGTVEKEQLEAFNAAAKKQIDGWATQAKTDPEIGGANFDANLVSAKNVLTAYGTPEFTTYLNSTGLGSHPAMIKLLLKVAKAVGEDKLLAGGQGSGQGQAKSTAEVLYGGSAKK